MQAFVINDLRTGDILHCKRQSLLSKFIRWFTKSDFTSHSAVVVKCWGQIYVVDAQKDGVNPRPIKKWLDKYGYDIVVARPRIGPRDPKAFSIRAFSKVGFTAYDFKSLFLKQPWYAITGKWRKEKNPEGKMYCSEYVAWCWRIETGYRMHPKALMDYTSQHNNFKHYQLLWTK